MIAHGNARLAAEVLDDDFLDVPVLLVEIPNRDERLDPLGCRLADPDQDAGREGDRELAGQRNGAKAPGGYLVRCAVVGQPGTEQALRERLEHDAHAYVDLAQRREVALAHEARV